jgi:formylglycine-generating enzyme required for sulfatase activity
VGQKKPNDLGLFDMHGNVWSWCQESFRPDAPGSADRPASDAADKGPIVAGRNRVLRGASFRYHPLLVRSAYRLGHRPGYRGNSIGLGVARTCD